MLTANPREPSFQALVRSEAEPEVAGVPVPVCVSAAVRGGASNDAKTILPPRMNEEMAGQRLELGTGACTYHTRVLAMKELME